MRIRGKDKIEFTKYLLVKDIENVEKSQEKNLEKRNLLKSQERVNQSQENPNYQMISEITKVDSPASLLKKFENEQMQDHRENPLKKKNSKKTELLQNNSQRKIKEKQKSQLAYQQAKWFYLKEQTKLNQAKNPIKSTKINTRNSDVNSANSTINFFQKYYEKDKPIKIKYKILEKSRLKTSKSNNLSDISTKRQDKQSPAKVKLSNLENIKGYVRKDLDKSSEIKKRGKIRKSSNSNRVIDFKKPCKNSVKSIEDFSSNLRHSYNFNKKDSRYYFDLAKNRSQNMEILPQKILNTHANNCTYNEIIPNSPKIIPNSRFENSLSQNLILSPNKKADPLKMNPFYFGVAKEDLTTRNKLKRKLKGNKSWGSPLEFPADVLIENPIDVQKNITSRQKKGYIDHNIINKSMNNQHMKLKLLDKSKGKSKRNTNKNTDYKINSN